MHIEKLGYSVCTINVVDLINVSFCLVKMEIISISIYSKLKYDYLKSLSASQICSPVSHKAKSINMMVTYNFFIKGYLE